MSLLCQNHQPGASPRHKKIDWAIVALLVFWVAPLITTAEENLVEVEYPQILVLPYKDRRSNWSLTTTLVYEQRKPKEFVSTEGDSYTTLFDSKTHTGAGVALGAQYNFEAFAIGLTASYTSGLLSHNPGSGFNDLLMNKLSVGGEFLLDAIWSEPRVVPIFKAQAYQVKWDLQTETGEDIGESAWANVYSGGLLIQMNAIEPDQSRQALHEHGLQNTFLELLLSQYTASPRAEDPDLSESMAVSLGLRVEFH